MSLADELEDDFMDVGYEGWQMCELIKYCLEINPSPSLQVETAREIFDDDKEPGKPGLRAIFKIAITMFGDMETKRTLTPEHIQVIRKIAFGRKSHYEPSDLIEGTPP
jgi:hypothetical protein